MFCSKCGTRIPDEAKFCYNCGSQLSVIAASPQAKQQNKTKNGCLPGCLSILVYLVIGYFLIPLFSSLFSSSSLKPTYTSTPVETPPSITATPYARTPPPITIKKDTPLIVQPEQSTETLTRSYSWSYRGDWTWELNIPKSYYDYYKNLPRPQTANYSVYVTHPQDDIYLDQLISKIEEAAQKKDFTEYQTIELVAAFVQSLPYTSDSVTTGHDEYPRYPVETLVDNGGDCEDTSILMASFLERMGYSAVLLKFPNHIAVGISGGEGIYGTYWLWKDKKYYYLETTGENWKVGELPDEYSGTLANIYDLTPTAILTHEWESTSWLTKVEMTVKVSNIGTAASNNTSVWAGFDAGSNQSWNAETSDPFIINSGEQVTVKLTLSPPSNKYTRLLVHVVKDGYRVDESYSKWFTTP